MMEQTGNIWNVPVSALHRTVEQFPSPMHRPTR